MKKIKKFLDLFQLNLTETNTKEKTMSHDVTYPCKTIEILRDLSFRGKRVFLCKYQCAKDGELLNTKTGIVVLANGEAKLEQYAENIVPDDAPDEEFNKYQDYISQYPVSYGFYNPEQVAKMLEEQTNSQTT